MIGRPSRRVCPEAACASPPSAQPACLVMSGCDAVCGLGGEECLDDRGEGFGVGGQVKVAAVIDVQLAARYQPVHDPGVDQRDDGVVRSEECLDDRGEVFGVGGQVKVAAVIDVQLAARYQPVHDPGVDQRDDGVVVAGQ